MRQLVVSISLLIAAIPRHAESQAITVRIHNVSGADEQSIGDLQEAATAVFRHAGIKIAWIDCAPALKTCDVPPAMNNIILLVVNDRFYPGHHAIGWTTLDTYVVTVHYRRAEKMSRASTLYLSCGRILGYTTAHEIGHLLLGSQHGLFGIMKPKYDGGDLLAMTQGRLYFSREDARQMGNRLQLPADNLGVNH